MTIVDQVKAALHNQEYHSERSYQSRAGKLGPSDIGFCRNKATLTAKGVQPTDDVSTWAASLGTAIHNYVESALHDMYPTWQLGSIHETYVKATLPCGAEIGGHPDIVIADEKTVIDIKTVNGFSWVRRAGVSDSHKYQRHLYALGLIQAYDWDPADVKVGNLYMDRSGAEDDFILEIEPFDPSLTSEIDDWVQDVMYAIQHDESAMRDIAAPVCERICSLFTACRGGLETSDEQSYSEKGLVEAVQAYVDARETEKEAKSLKTQAQLRLRNVNGVVDGMQVRWVEIATTGNMRLDVRKAR